MRSNRPEYVKSPVGLQACVQVVFDCKTFIHKRIAALVDVVWVATHTHCSPFSTFLQKMISQRGKSMCEPEIKHHTGSLNHIL